MTLPEKPEFAVNTPDATVADALNGFIRFATDGLVGETRVDIATAYFNVGGYRLLADSLDGVDGIRILVGAEPDDRERRVRHLRGHPSSAARAGRVRLQQALEGLQRDLSQSRDLLGFTVEADESARRLVTWLRSGKVQVRRLEDRFLHGKAFIVADHHHGVVAGSSNFTHAGLARNVELNLGNYTPTVVSEVSGWYDELWDAASEYDLAALFEERFEPHAPQLIYFRMLFERYGEELEAEADASGQPKIHLTSFQRDGLWRARRILENLGGVLIADEVGLGKTFLAGELIREASIERRQRVLVIAPATLRDGPWRAFLSAQLLPVEIKSFDDVAADTRLNPENGTGRKLDADNINDYAMVVIDEAHNLRNPSTQRADALRRLLAGSPPKKLLLLTATPVNNSLWDLYYLLGYFVRNDATFADVGIKSLRDHFARAMALNPDDLTPEHLFDVLDAVAVRRTRSFVKRFYPNDTVRIDGVEVPILFPTPRVRKVSYDLGAVLPGFFEKFAHAIEPTTVAPEDDPGVLTFARYAPSSYRLDGDSDTYELQLAGLLGSGLLKRFESSPYAFAQTCEKMAKNHDAFLALLSLGKVAKGGALADWIATDSDDTDEIDLYMDAYVDVIDDVAEYDVASLAAHVEHDRDLLREFAVTAGAVDRASDPTLTALVEELATIVDQAADEGIGADDVRDKRKVLIFSYFSDTVEWVVDHLRTIVEDDPRLAPYRDRITSISGGGGKGSKDSVLWGFAPRTTDAPSGFDDDRFDIVVTTDVLAEGVNLQQARHIINYDLPWNPMRLVQRHGRIDRIGSRHSEVFLRCVFPDDKLDELLGLEARLQHKIKQAAATVGVGHVLPDQASVDRDFSETRDEIDRLRNEDNDLFERGGTTRGVLSGEEFRQELRAALEDDQLAEQIAELPWGSGSGMAVERAGQVRTGYVFCARIGDWERPVFRYVETGGGAEPLIVDDTLTCLDHARPSNGFDTPRVLDDETYRGAFEAWNAACEDVVERWNWHADKANLEPQVPKVLARAADLVRAHPPKDLHQDEIDRVIDTLQAPYPERILRTFRTALSVGDEAAQASSVVRIIDDLGLQPYEAPEPLPDITDDDVNLVCWMAITSGGVDPAWLAAGELPIRVAETSGQSSFANQTTERTGETLEG